MDTIQKFEQFIQQSTVAACVLGRDDIFFLAFVEPDGSLSPTDTFLPSLLGFHLCGVLGVGADGFIRWETEPGQENFHLTIMAAKVFADHPRVEVAGLEQLYSVPDTRTEDSR